MSTQVDSFSEVIIESVKKELNRRIAALADEVRLQFRRDMERVIDEYIADTAQRIHIWTVKEMDTHNMIIRFNFDKSNKPVSEKL